MQNIPRVYVGIGNPGDEYKDIRHNVGRDWIDFAAKKLNLQWTLNESLECELAYFNDGKMLFVKPTRFMNMSGVPMAKIMNEMQVSIGDCVFVHDCLFTKFGTWRFQRGFGSAGHPAINSVMEYCSHSFWRFRIGVGAPPRYELLSKYITNPWTLREKQLIYSDVYDSILYHLLNTVMAETEQIPINAETLKKDPLLKYYKPYLVPAEGYWPGSKNDDQIDKRFEPTH